MTDLGGVFDSYMRDFLPGRLMLDPERFESAFESFKAREAASGRKSTIESFAQRADIADRVLRKARAGKASLPRHQVVTMAGILACAAGELVRDPSANRREAGQLAATVELGAWPVPLLEVRSWSEFVERLKRADDVRLDWGDDALDLGSACEIDRLRSLLEHARRIVGGSPAVAGAALKDAADDLAFHGLHVLAGRFVGRIARNDAECAIAMVYVVEMRVSPWDALPDHVVDRSAEPCTTSDIEDFFADDVDAIEGWLEWEGKRRLALWPRP